MFAGARFAAGPKSVISSLRLELKWAEKKGRNVQDTHQSLLATWQANPGQGSGVVNLFTCCYDYQPF